jgi:hypothetical protein
MVAIPWTLLWLSIIARHWNTLPARAILRSFAHLCAITAPAYMRPLLGRERYLRHRTAIVCAAISAYAFHPGGGLYRDAIQTNAAEHTGLDAAALFVRVVVGSRTLFWLVLVLGYQLPPLVGIPLNAAGLAVITRWRPSTPFCAAIQTPATRDTFAYIVARLPLVGVLPLRRPLLAGGADVCDMLVQWVQLAFGFALPAAISLAADFAARRAWARRRGAALGAEDRRAWLSPATTAFSPAALAALLFINGITALWYLLAWGKAEP